MPRFRTNRTENRTGELPRLVFFFDLLADFLYQYAYLVDNVGQQDYNDENPEVLEHQDELCQSQVTTPPVANMLSLWVTLGAWHLMLRFRTAPTAICCSGSANRKSCASCMHDRFLCAFLLLNLIVLYIQVCFIQRAECE